MTTLRNHLLVLCLLSAFAMPAFAAPATTGPGVGSQTTGPGVGGQTTGPGVGGQTTGPGVAKPTGLQNPLNGIDSLDDFLEAILAGVIRIGTIILIMMLVYVGFLFVAARGNAEKLQGAKSALVWTVIGGLILLGASAIQAVITDTVQSLQ